MRKLKEVLRLHSLGMSQHQIARSCTLSQSTVPEYLSAAQAAGVKWPAPENWGDQQIEQALVPQRPGPAVWRKHPEPNWSQIHLVTIPTRWRSTSGNCCLARSVSYHRQSNRQRLRCRLCR